jgi:hypothetical protein
MPNPRPFFVIQRTEKVYVYGPTYYKPTMAVQPFCLDAGRDFICLGTLALAQMGARFQNQCDESLLTDNTFNTPRN